MLELKYLDFKDSNIELLVIPVCQNNEIHSDTIISNLIKNAENTANFKAKDGEIIAFFLPSGTLIKRVVFLGLGEFKKVDCQKIRSFAGKTVNYCMANEIRAITYAMPSPNKFNVDDHDLFYSVMEGSFLSNYRFNLYKKKESENLLEKIVLAVSDKKQLDFVTLIQEVKTVCDGTILARNWGNIPSNNKNPDQLARLIKNCSEHTSVDTNVFSKDWLQNEKFGAMLAVGQGSSSTPCLVTMDYSPSKSQRTILLVGKGVTFDSGGLNLKPGMGLEEMKTDMCGAAAVAGILIVVSKLKLQDRVIGIMPLVENMLSGNAIHPGDIIETFLGKTVEIGNTDAEGRLILADALSWGINKYKPDIVIDIATLTGACAVALGDKIAGVFSKNTYLSDAIVEAGNKTFERCWNMPLPDDYLELLESNVADLSNISSSKWGGAITAALFLSEFVDEEVPWAHIDIAGPARSSKKTDYCEIGATGFGVRLIYEFIKNLKK